MRHCHYIYGHCYRAYPHLDPSTTDPYAGIHRIKAFAISMALGIGIGIAVAFLLRETKLRWTWTLPGALLVPIVGQIDWRLGVSYGNAVLFASGFGYWLHKQEKERGGPEAREEEERIGPLRWARLTHLARQAERRARRRGQARGRHEPAGRALLGPVRPRPRRPRSRPRRHRVGEDGHPGGDRSGLHP